ncbi:hypothetical protein JCM3770_004455 [Rhodotorula araucariae]
MATSESGAVILQLAMSFTRNCGMSISIDGIDPRISSMLADGVTGYTSERAELSSSLQEAAATGTSSDDAEQTGGARTTASATSAAAQTGVAQVASETGSSSAPAASRTGNAASGAPSLAGGAPHASPPHLLVLTHPPLPNHEMSTPDKISSTGSLSDRLARLGLGHPTSPSSPSSSPTSGLKTSAVRTGAVTKVSDKISRFQAQAEDRPLLPSGGSFGLAPAKPRASSGRDRYADERPRVASLGGGRAAVPLDVVTPRSVSAGNSPRTSDSGSTPSSRAASRLGLSREASGGDPSARESPVGDATPIPSPSRATTSALNALNLLPAGARTPGAMSVSSMRVETGSVSSEGGPNPALIDVQAALAARDSIESPLSSPVLAGIAIATSSAGSVSSVDGITPSLPPVGFVKNPLDSLRTSSRPGSVHSVSSLVVEAPFEDVADLSAMSTSGSAYGSVTTPTREVAGLGLDDHSDYLSDGDHAEERTPAEDDERELARQAKMRAELAEYEADARDPPALGPYQEDEPGMSGSAEDGEFKEPPFANEDCAERPETPTPGTKTPPSPVPAVKCSDCGEEVQLIELADHFCMPSAQAPARPSPPGSPPASQPAALPTLSSPPPAMPDVPEEPFEDDVLPEPALSRSTSHRSKKQSVEPGIEKLDEFVPQTDDLVPEDILDAYTDEQEEQVATASSFPQDVADVPYDDGDGADAHAHAQPTMSSAASVHSTPMARSASTPSGAATRLRQPKTGSSKPRVQSAYGGPMPGRYYTSDDEDEGEPGSATIVRSPSTSGWRNSP